MQSEKFPFNLQNYVKTHVPKTCSVTKQETAVYKYCKRNENIIIIDSRMIDCEWNQPAYLFINKRYDVDDEVFVLSTTPQDNVDGHFINSIVCIVHTFIYWVAHSLLYLFERENRCWQRKFEEEKNEKINANGSSNDFWWNIMKY